MPAAEEFSNKHCFQLSNLSVCDIGNHVIVVKKLYILLKSLTLQNKLNKLQNVHIYIILFKIRRINIE